MHSAWKAVSGVGLTAALLVQGEAQAKSVQERAAPGRVAVTIGGERIASFTAIVSLPGGGTLAAAEAQGVDRGAKSRVFVVRFRRDGSVDRQYGRGGVARIEGLSVGLLAPGARGGATLVLAGRERPLEHGAYELGKLRVVRLNSRGLPDKAFGAGGVRDVPSLTAGNVDPPLAAAAPGQGVVVAGWLPDGSGGAVRVTPAGEIDPTFGTGGVTPLPGPGALAMQPDGKLLVAGGIARDPGAEEHDVALYRYSANGEPDRQFGANGVATVPEPQRPPFAIRIDGRRRIWMAGELGIGDEGARLRRWRPNGRADRSFTGDSGAGYVSIGRAADLLLVDEHGALIAQTDLRGRARLSRVGERGAITGERYPVGLGGGWAPGWRNRQFGTFGGGLVLGSRTAAVRPDGSLVLAGAAVLVDRWQPNDGWATPAVIALREGEGLVRGFGVPSRAPDVALSAVSLASRERFVRLRLRSDRRGIARVTVWNSGRRIAARMVSMPELGPASYRARMPVTEAARPLVRSAKRLPVIVRVDVNDMAGNVRHRRFRAVL